MTTNSAITAIRQTTHTAPSEHSWASVLTSLLDRHDLSPAAAAWAIDQIVAGQASGVHIAGFLTALRAKGETASEVAAIADAVRRHAVPFTVPGPTADIAGTGGDGSSAINVSTLAAIVGRSDRGNHAQARWTGSIFDHRRLSRPHRAPRRAPGPHTPAGAAGGSRSGDHVLVRPSFNPGLRHAGPVRRALGVPTILNVIGPLLNPATPIGVADERIAPLVAEVLAHQGRCALVVRGRDGLDKITTLAASDVWIVDAGRLRHHVLDPRVRGIARPALAALRGADAASNAHTAHAVLGGEPGAVRDIVVLNAAAVLVALDLSQAPLEEQFTSAMQRCTEALDTGAATATLQRWVAASQHVSTAPPPSS